MENNDYQATLQPNPDKPCRDQAYLITIGILFFVGIILLVTPLRLPSEDCDKALITSEVSEQTIGEPETVSEEKQDDRPAPGAVEYKESFLGGEIPVTWNELSVYETIVTKGDHPSLKNIRYSIAPNKIIFNEAWEQIDFYFMTKEAAADFLVYIETPPTREIELGGHPTTVINYSLDNGEVTKAGTGGAAYLIQIPESQRFHESQPSYLLINKNALGSDDFEKAFVHYMETADFRDLFNK